MSDVNPPEAAPKKKGHGCLIALAVVGALVMLVVLGSGIAAWRFSRTDKGRALGHALGAGVRGLSAPGTKELADAYGCRAIVIDTRSFDDAMKAFDAKRNRDDYRGIVVGCKVENPPTVPTCAQIGQTYRKAVGETGEFAVELSNGNTRVCHEIIPALAKP